MDEGHIKILIFYKMADFWTKNCPSLSLSLSLSLSSTSTIDGETLLFLPACILLITVGQFIYQHFGIHDAEVFILNNV